MSKTVRGSEKTVEINLVEYKNFHPINGIINDFSIRLTVKPQTDLGNKLTLSEIVQPPFYFLQGVKNKK